MPGWTVYQNAYLIWILPHSLLTVSLATAMLPSASRHAVAGNRAGVAAETDRALRLATTFLVPASVGLLALADPLSRLAFGNGTGAADYLYITWALMAFSVGLVPFTIQYLHLRAFFAMDNTRTPFLLQAWISGANAVFGLSLALPWDDQRTVAARLALAYSLSYVVGMGVTYVALRRRLPELDLATTLRHLARVLVASLPAAALAWAITWWFERYDSLLLRMIGLALAGVVGVLAFFFTAKRLGVDEATSLLQQLRRGKREDGPGDAPEAVPDQAVQPAGHVPPEGAVDPDGMGVFVPVAPAGSPSGAPSTLGYFPEPPITGTPQAEPPPDARVLGQRFRLAELLASRGRAQTWRADDLVLGRAVLVHLLDSSDPGSAEVFRLSRDAALVTDSRFLRVLDVVDADPEVGPYLVYEYAAGQTLETVLRGGPLTGVEAAWIVREVADALIALHTQEYYHRRLSPATVLVTTTGNVKILGFAVDSASPPSSTHLNGEATDVRALGQLLYASLVARWPGGDQFGLPAAPVVDGNYPPPSQVRTGVAPAVDQVVDRILSPVPRGRATRLTTAQDVTIQLSLVLGPMGAAHDLRARLRPSVDPDAETPPAPVSLVAPPIPTPASSRFSVSASASPWAGEEEDADAGPHLEDERPADHPDHPAGNPPWTDNPDHPAGNPPWTDSPGNPAGDGRWADYPDDLGEETELFVDEALSRGESFTPVPPPARPTVDPASAAPKPRKRRLPLLLGALALVLVVGIAAAVALGSRGPGDSSALARLEVTAATAFDPKADGGDGAEISKNAKLAVDARANTTWRTQRYPSAAFGKTKPGVGLVLDLGAERTVNSVRLTLEGTDSAVELRVPVETTDKAPLKSVKLWRPVASVTDAGTSVVVTPGQPVRTRFLLVYLTSLPKLATGDYRGGVTDVVVSGS